jgi:hypothetical protein
MMQRKSMLLLLALAPVAVCSLLLAAQQPRVARLFDIAKAGKIM